MTPEERDRMVRLESHIDNMGREIASMYVVVQRLDKQSTYVRGGLLVILGLGGLVTFFSDLAKKWFF